ncbi:hypothetical protein SLA2020_181010 [Shorea laevis]
MESVKCVCFILLLLLLHLLIPSSDSISFHMSRFDPSSSDILYEGDAVPFVGAIELNNKLAYLFQVGRVTYAKKVLLWDSNSGKLSDFTSHFSFTIDTLGANKFGSGIAFFLAPVGFQIPPNSGGAFLGLFNTTTGLSSVNKIVMVEFDTFNNPEWDPQDVQSHVGIKNNSIASVVYTSGMQVFIVEIQLMY